MKKLELTEILVWFAILFFAVVGWAAPVPDTGVTQCYNATVAITCPSPGQAFYGQDANYSINPMSYTKLDGSGNALSDEAVSWAMARDNLTGLIWENKTDDGTIHDKDNKYTWYDPTSPYYSGTPGDGTDTKDFIDALNSASFGGYSDWRLPTASELVTIVNYRVSYPAISPGYFQNTGSSSYWSSTTYAHDTSRAFVVGFSSGSVTYGYKDHSWLCSCRARWTVWIIRSFVYWVI